VIIFDSTELEEGDGTAELSVRYDY
jgi:hypothetical protein